MYMFASKVTHNGYHGPPSSVTNSKITCPRKNCTRYAFASIFHGLLLDDDFVETTPLRYLHDPHTMPRALKAKLMLDYFHKQKVCPKTRVPIFLQSVDESDDDEDEFDVNASEEEVEEMEARMNAVLQADDNMERVRNELAAIVAKENGQEQRRKNCFVFIKTHALEILALIDNYRHCRQEGPGVPLAKFKALFTEAIKKVPGLEHFSHDNLPAMVSIDDSVWNNRKNKYQRLEALAKLKSQILTVMRPSSDDREPGQCSHAGCNRNCLEYGGSSFQYDHADDDAKSDDPSRLARLSSDRLINELDKDSGGGMDDVCGLHHEKGKDSRNFEVDLSKWIKMTPCPAQARGDGKNFLEELRKDKVLRLKFTCTCLIIESYIRGWSTKAPKKSGDFDTLRVVVETYFGILADDYIVGTASQWNDGLLGDRSRYFNKMFHYIIQDVSGTCAAATAAGTKDAERKPPGDWNESDYACKEGDYDLKNLAVLERQGIEADHDKATSKGKTVARAANLLNKIDEACHAPYHCYFCHKRRTANQHKKNSWSSANRDYTN